MVEPAAPIRPGIFRPREVVEESQPPGGVPPDDGGIDARVGRLERAIHDLRVDLSALRGDLSGLKHAQNVTIAAVVGIGAILFAAIVYVAAAVNSLPAQLTDIATSISSGITAARSVDQRAPIIINVPPFGSDTSGASPSRPELPQQSAPSQTPSAGSSETPAPSDSGEGQGEAAGQGGSQEQRE